MRQLQFSSQRAGAELVNQLFRAVSWYQNRTKVFRLWEPIPKTRGVGLALALALALINANATDATPRESKMEEKCWNKKDAQGVPA